EDWRAAALLLLDNFAAHGLRCWSGIEGGVANVQSRIAVAVVTPHGGLRRVGNRVVQQALRIGDQTTDVSKTIEIGPVCELLRIAELADIAAISVEDDDEVRLAERRYGNFFFRKGGHRNRGADGDGAKQPAVRGKDLHRIRCAVRDVNSACGVDIAVFAKKDGRVRGLFARGSPLDQKELLILRIKDHETRGR